MLGLLSFSGITQNITNSRAKELFGYRYISPREAGFSDNLEIPFSEEAIKDDFSSWYLPINLNGEIKYRRLLLTDEIQIPPEKSDTLSLLEAKKVICLLAKIRPSFPNESGINEPLKYFFRVKDERPSQSGLKFRPIIAYNNGMTLIVNLPSLAKAGVLKSNYISYLIKTNYGQDILGLAVLPNNMPPMTERFISILTLTYSQ